VRVSAELVRGSHPGKWLAQLEQIGLRRIGARRRQRTTSDFTGNFQIAAIRAELEKLREKSENIAQLLAR